MFSVLLTEGAAADLARISEYLVRVESVDRALHVISRIEHAFESLAEFPDRGVFPKELSSLGIREFREVLFKPYRVVYRVDGTFVYVYLIADGRRDMQNLLLHRLLRS